MTLWERMLSHAGRQLLQEGLGIIIWIKMVERAELYLEFEDNQEVRWFTAMFGSGQEI